MMAGDFSPCGACRSPSSCWALKKCDHAPAVTVPPVPLHRPLDGDGVFKGGLVDPDAVMVGFP